MKMAFFEDPALTLHKTESAKSPSGTALDFARPTGTERDGSETNRSQCKTVSRPPPYGHRERGTVGMSAMSRREIDRMYQTLKAAEMPRGLQPEAATVYRGGGRRWLTKAAAEKAEARKLIKTRCECCKGDWQTPAYTCSIHRDPARFDRMVRLTVAMVVRRAPTESGGR